MIEISKTLETRNSPFPARNEERGTFLRNGEEHSVPEEPFHSNNTPQPQTQFQSDPSDKFGSRSIRIWEIHLDLRDPFGSGRSKRIWWLKDVTRSVPEPRNKCLGTRNEARGTRNEEHSSGTGKNIPYLRNPFNTTPHSFTKG